MENVTLCYVFSISRGNGANELGKIMVGVIAIILD